MNVKSKEFIEAIDEIVLMHDCEYMDAVVMFCQTRAIEIESVVSIIRNNEDLKAKIASEAKSLNLIRE